MAFNVQNLYHLEALRRVTEKLRLPCIVQFSARYVRQFEKTVGFEMLLSKYKNDYMYFHLDHCQDFELITFCIDSGFDGVMYDGSASPLAENIQFTKKVMAYAQSRGCIVEGELGEIGGVEDGVGTEHMAYANLAEVKRYVSETKVHLLALGIGNAHGFYTTLSKIDTSILRQAQSKLEGEQMLVLHGGSGLSKDIIDDCVTSGVVKINFSTQIKQATNDGIKKYIEKLELFNEIKFEQAIIDEVSPVFRELITKYTKGE